MPRKRKNFQISQEKEASFLELTRWYERYVDAAYHIPDSHGARRCNAINWMLDRAQNIKKLWNDPLVRELKLDKMLPNRPPFLDVGVFAFEPSEKIVLDGTPEAHAKAKEVFISSDAPEFDRAYGGIDATLGTLILADVLYCRQLGTPSIPSELDIQALNELEVLHYLRKSYERQFQFIFKLSRLDGAYDYMAMSEGHLERNEPWYRLADGARSKYESLLRDEIERTRDLWMRGWQPHWPSHMPICFVFDSETFDTHWNGMIPKVIRSFELGYEDREQLIRIQRELDKYDALAHHAAKEKGLIPDEGTEAKGPAGVKEEASLEHKVSTPVLELRTAGSEIRCKGTLLKSKGKGQAFAFLKRLAEEPGGTVSREKLLDAIAVGYSSELQRVDRARYYLHKAFIDAGLAEVFDELIKLSRKTPYKPGTGGYLLNLSPKDIKLE